MLRNPSLFSGRTRVSYTWLVIQYLQTFTDFRSRSFLVSSWDSIKWTILYLLERFSSIFSISCCFFFSKLNLFQMCLWLLCIPSVFRFLSSLHTLPLSFLLWDYIIPFVSRYSMCLGVVPSSLSLQLINLSCIIPISFYNFQRHISGPYIIILSTSASKIFIRFVQFASDSIRWYSISFLVLPLSFCWWFLYACHFRSFFIELIDYNFKTSHSINVIKENSWETIAFNIWDLR